ncbi:MAG TPA: MinD/ParA family protein [Roseiflexaceae bacterium]|nr:MinD/ParA family protein [Roseiflexaceae bacterium]
MAKIISVHSFRGGTGKSNITANLAALLAASGRRIGVVDTDIQSPGIHILFGVDEASVAHSLNDYLWGRCDIQQAAIDVTTQAGAAIEGRIFLIPSSMKSGEIARILREGCDARVLTSGFRKLIKTLDLDILLIDTHPGLNEETLLSIALSHALVMIMRPDQQDYAGTAVALEVATALNVPRLLMCVNKVLPVFEPESVRAQVAQTFDCEVAAVIPHSDEMMLLASAGIFALRYPDHPISTILGHVSARLLAE